MYAQVEKPKENKSRSVANSVAQKKSNGKQGFGFVDNRLEASERKRWQQKITKNNGSAKLKDNSQSTRHNLQLMQQMKESLQVKESRVLQQANMNTVTVSQKTNNVLQLSPEEFKAKYFSLKEFKPQYSIFHPEWNVILTQYRSYSMLRSRNGVGNTLMSVYLKSQNWGTKYCEKFTEREKELYKEITAYLKNDIKDYYDTDNKDTQGIAAGNLDTSDEIETSFLPGMMGNDSMFTAFYESLFTKKPEMEDIKQGSIGDCFLLAAMVSIMSVNPQHFYSHMKDNLDGTVTVKLYSAPNKPIQIVVSKSAAGETFAKEYLWVKLMEKAYAAANFNQKGEEGDLGYESISGGHSEEAMMHLTGLATGTKNAAVSRKNLINDDDIQLEIMKIGNELTIQKNTKDLKVFNKAMDIMYNDIQKLTDLTYISNDDWTALVNKHALVNKYIKRLEPLLLQQAAKLPGKLGNAVYSPNETTMFKLIKDTVDAKKPITASTKQKISDPKNKVEGKGYAGEDKVAGLVSKHAYSILGYKPKSLDNLAPNTSLLILLRNPWGKYSREYQQGQDGLKGVSKEDGDGKFWIDIADFNAYFEKVSFVK